MGQVRLYSLTKELVPTSKHEYLLPVIQGCDCHPSSDESISHYRSTRPLYLQERQCCLWPREAVKHIWTGAGCRFCTEGPHNLWQEGRNRGRGKDSWLWLHTSVVCCVWIIVSAPHGQPNSTLFTPILSRTGTPKGNFLGTNEHVRSQRGPAAGIGPMSAEEQTGVTADLLLGSSEIRHQILCQR